ncbi:uncharacterized protein LOC122316211 [Carya illinoinensis]|uniref:uncharacterized protein LOC122316211 n=1 Tax=Carya illinoinensis TaxID=32201 RepID=UPI001C71D29D|nr:uncharacterized protein LOC122316211 [Carya illinoinensis]
MKIFAWRVCQEKLPTYLNLNKKHVLEDATCVLFNQGMEDAAHALYFCSEVRNMWGDFCSQMDNMQSDLSFWDLENLARDRGSDSLLARFVAIMWGLWYRMNKRIYENISMHINVIVNNALSLQQEYAQVQLFDVSNQKINKVVRWHPPPLDFLKLNIDGTTFPDHSVAGIGVVLRDHNGVVVVACSKVEKEVSSAEFIEAIVLLRGLQLCVQ